LILKKEYIMDSKRSIIALCTVAALGGTIQVGAAIASGVGSNTSINIPDANFSLIYGPGYATNSSAGSYGTGGTVPAGDYGLPGIAGPQTGTTATGASATDTSGFGLTTIYKYSNGNVPDTITYTNPGGSGTYTVSGFNNAYIPDWTGNGGAVGAGNYAPVYSNGGLFGQVLNTPVAPNTTYMLTAYVHNTNNGSDAPLISLTAGSSGNYSSNPAIAGGVYYGTPGAAGASSSPVSEVVTTGSNVSGNLGITLGSSGLQNVFTNVTLVANPTTLPTGTSYTQPNFVNNGITITNAGPFAPTPGPADQSNLSPTGTTGAASPGYPTAANTTINYYTNNAAAPGQTFTTGKNGGGYNLNSVTINVADPGTGTFSDGNSLTLDVASVNTAKGTYQLMDVLTGTVVAGSGIGQGDYVTLALSSPIHLAAVSTYGFAISGATGYAGLLTDSAASDYGGGQLAEFQPGSDFGGTLITSSAVPQSVFDVSLTPVAATPEPAPLALLALGCGAMLAFRRRRI
jgi:hypothetical protein